LLYDNNDENKTESVNITKLPGIVLPIVYKACSMLIGHHEVLAYPMEMNACEANTKGEIKYNILLCGPKHYNLLYLSPPLRDFNLTCARN